MIKNHSVIIFDNAKSDGKIYFYRKMRDELVLINSCKASDIIMEGGFDEAFARGFDLFRKIFLSRINSPYANCE